MMFRRLVVVLAAAAGGAYFGPLAHAQEQSYPARPLRLIVTSSAGGSSDTIARTIASETERHLGGNIVVDNRPGAAGIIGYDIVARSAADGYTLLHATAGLVINPSIHRKVPYKVTDLTPITSLGLGQGYLIVINPAVPAHTVKELVAVAKQKDKGLTFASSGIGNPLHLAGEVFNDRAGIRLLHVPYKGVGPALNALASGEIQVMFVPPTVTVPHIKSGRVRAIAFTGPRRWPQLANIPTVAEAAFPGFDVSGSWHAWFAPTGTPEPIINKLYAAVRRALDAPKVQAFLNASGYDTDGRSPAETRAFMADELKRYAKIVRAAGIKPQ